MSTVPITPEAKLWELLRRNPEFRRTTAQLAELAAKAQAERTAEGARWQGFNLVRDFDSPNAFAALALRWLVPNPSFIHRTIVLPPDFDKSKALVAPYVVRLGLNLLPEHDDGSNWKWFDAKGRFNANRVANIKGWPIRWGPEITKVVTDEPLLKNSCRDEIAEWRAYFTCRKFDVDTPWEAAPPHFRRSFTGLWSSMLGNSFGVYETNYFKGPNPAASLIDATKILKAANECIRKLVHDLDRVRRGEPETVCPSVPTKGGNSMRTIPQFAFSPSEADQAQTVQFDDLARNRVFVVPHVLRRKDAARIVEAFSEQLVAQLPDDGDLLGTKSFWETVIGVESMEAKMGCDTTAAIGRYVQQKWGRSAVHAKFRGDPERLKRWFRNGALLPAPPKERRRERDEWQSIKTFVNPILRELDRTYRSPVKTRVRFIHELSAATFPSLNLEELTARPPHKRKNSK